MHKVNGHKFHRPKSSIYPSHQLIHARSQILVLFDVSTRGDGYLDKNDFSYHLGVRSQEGLESMKLLRDSFNVVESVDTDYNLDTLEPGTEFGDSLLHSELVDGLQTQSDVYYQLGWSLSIAQAILAVMN